MPEAGHAREGRLHAGVAALALDGFDERGFLAADVAAEAGAHFDVEGEVGAEELLSQVAFGPGLLDGLVEPELGEVVFAPDVDEALIGAHGKAGDGHAFQDLVGVALHDIAVLDGAGLAFVGVADDVFLGHRQGPGEGPLEAGGEAGAAAAAQARGLYFLHHRSGVRLVSTFFKVA